MREFEFDLVFGGEAVDPAVSGFRSDETTSTGIGGCLDGDRFWRIERLNAPAATLDIVEERLETVLSGVDGLTGRSFEADVTGKVLTRTETDLEFYCRVENIVAGDTVYTLAAEHIGHEVLFEFERSQRTETWRVLMDSDERVGILYDALQAALRPAIRFDFGHVGEATGWQTEFVSQIDIPPEQRTALELAVQRGYYETPRDVTLDELSASLDCPRSTLSYRLRRAEARLANAFSASGVDDALGALNRTPDEVSWE